MEIYIHLLETFTKQLSRLLNSTVVLTSATSLLPDSDHCCNSCCFYCNYCFYCTVNAIAVTAASAATTTITAVGPKQIAIQRL